MLSVKLTGFVVATVGVTGSVMLVPGVLIIVNNIKFSTPALSRAKFVQPTLSYVGPAQLVRSPT